MPRSLVERYSICVVCGSEFAGKWSGPVARYCGSRCRSDARNARERERRRTIDRRVVACANPFCSNLFVVHVNSRKKTCGKDCSYVVGEWRKDGVGALEMAAISRGQLQACRIWYTTCVDCGAIFVRKWKRAGVYQCCRPCARIRRRATDARRSHKRRAAGPKVMSVDQIAARDGCACYVCGRRVDLSLSGSAKWGPTIEHRIPVSRGGTNDPENLALSHRYCNVSRGNRGHAQLMLVA